MVCAGPLILLLGSDIFSTAIAVYCFVVPLAFVVPAPSWSLQGTAQWKLFIPFSEKTNRKVQVEKQMQPIWFCAASGKQNSS